jgi:hypothetical protein
VVPVLARKAMAYFIQQRVLEHCATVGGESLPPERMKKAGKIQQQLKGHV